MGNALPAAHMLTCAPRAATLALTLASWEKTNWPGKLHIHTDPAPETPQAPWGATNRVGSIDRAFLFLLRQALALPGADHDWLLLLEDDIAFHPLLPSLLASWGALSDARCQLASLFNPTLQADPIPDLPPRSFAASPHTFLGGQALLLRRRAAATVLEKWDTASGVKSCRLARLLPGPILVHRPSLVQHTATDSAWNTRIQRAPDFDPAWTSNP